MKTCKTCKIEKELTEYLSCTVTKGGYRNQCKPCFYAMKNANRNKNRKAKTKFIYNTKNIESLEAITKNTMSEMQKFLDFLQHLSK